MRMTGLEVKCRIGGGGEEFRGVEWAGEDGDGEIMGWEGRVSGNVGEWGWEGGDVDVGVGVRGLRVGDEFDEGGIGSGVDGNGIGVELGVGRET
ncbi:hypothetical protein U1Q18_036612 [Sarracenia purpurea var. burkii]